jgi:hypothetical protein
MDKLQREDVFMTDNERDFPADSPGGEVTSEMRPKMADVLVKDAAVMQESGEKRAAQEGKDAARDEVVDLLRDFSTAGIGIGTEVPGLAAQFRVPHNRNDQNLIAVATAFYDASEPHKAPFEKLLGGGCRASLITARDAFAEARAAYAGASEGKAGAAGALDALFRELMLNSRKRDAIVRLKYRNDPQKLAAWTVASHLERAPKRQAEPKPANPEPTPANP